VREIRRYGGPRVIVVYDAPTARLGVTAEQITQGDEQVRVIERPKRYGRGTAGISGFIEALVTDADYIVEMDGDGQHDPNELPVLVEGLVGADVVIGSRYVGPGGDNERGVVRRLISRFSNAYVRLILGLPYRDCNSGYRAFRRHVFELVPPEIVWARGPGVVHETLYRLHCAGFDIVEVPIHFRERKKGRSKLRFGMLVMNAIGAIRLRLASMVGKL